MSSRMGSILVLLVLGSGGYGNSFVSQSCKYTYTRTYRKVFSSDGQAKEYIDENDRETKDRYLRFRASVDKAIAAAKGQGMPILPYDPFQPAIAAKHAALVKREAYPLNLFLDVSHFDGATERIEVTVKSPPKGEQLAGLTQKLKKLTAVERKDDEAPRDVSGFVAPVAVTHIGERLGIYVGMVAESDEPDVWRKIFQARLDRVRPLLEKRLAEDESQLTAPIGPLQPVLDAQKRPVTLVFNPWGPLLSGPFARVRNDLGIVSVIVMVAPQGQYDWKKFWPVIDGWLDTALADPHRELVEREAERVLGAER